MTITINNESIDFTLEKEQSAGAVMQAVSSWLEESGMLVKEVKMNGHTILLGEEDWKNQPLEDVKSIDIQAVDLREARIHQLQTARDYFNLLHQAASEADREQLEELADSFNDVQKLLAHLLGNGSQPANPGVYTEGLEKAGFFPSKAADAEAPSSDFEAIAGEATSITLLLDQRLRETASPEQEALSASLMLAKLAENLEDVAVQLQTGNDKAAMDTIIVLTELLQTLMRSLAWLPGAESALSIARELNGIFAEMEEAMKLSDTVLLGDLLEYEMKPRLQELPTAMERLEAGK